MRRRDVAAMAFQNIVRLKLKSGLSILSIAIGVAAVYMILSICSTGEKLVQTEIERLGIDGLSLYTVANGSSNGKIDLSFADSLKTQFDFVEETMPLVTIYGNFSIRGDHMDSVYLGADENLAELMGVQLLHGRLFSAQDLKYERNVAVIDRDLAVAAYKRENIVGKRMRIYIGDTSAEFEIIGIIASQTSMLDGISGGRIPEFIYIPYTTANAMNHTDEADQIAIRCSASMDTAEAASVIVSTLNSGNDARTYAVENVNGYVGQIKDLIGMISILLTVIGGISLFVAGIGVMNRMLSSVIERKKEIGIWIALGARERDVFLILLTESMLLCLIGGSIGSGIGLILVESLKLAAGLEYGVELTLLAIPLLTALMIGIAFGVLPSKRAAHMHPVELLRES